MNIQDKQQRTVALIVSTYNQPRHLLRCLAALKQQTYRNFEILVADDGSTEEIADVIEAAANDLLVPVTHVWQSDRGFRKTRILNKAILATNAEYLIFIDGDCIAHPDFVGEHVKAATEGVYLNAAMIRMSEALSDKIDVASINSGAVFNTRWLRKKGGTWNRRFLKLSLPYPLRRWLNRVSPTQLYWLGANSSCFRESALAVNGFDNRFTYGFEDGDFGNRLKNLGVHARTVRWTANVLHLHHDRPYTSPEEKERNRQQMTRVEPGGISRTPDGLAELGDLGSVGNTTLTPNNGPEDSYPKS